MTNLFPRRALAYSAIALVASSVPACSGASSNDDDTTNAAIAASELDDGTADLANAGDDGADETDDAEPEADAPRADDEDEPDDFAGDDPNSPLALVESANVASETDAVRASERRSDAISGPELSLDSLTILSSSSGSKHPRLGISNSRPDALTRSPSAWKGLHVRYLRVFVPWDVALRGDGDSRRMEFEGALAAAGPAHVQLLVMFSPCNQRDAESSKANFDGQRNPKKIFCEVKAGTGSTADIQWTPKAGAYDAAFKSFRAQYISSNAKATANHWPHVRFIGAWNEPNFGSVDKNNIRTPSNTPLWTKSCGGRRGDACGATLAAHYYKIAESRCLAKVNGKIKRNCRVLAGEFTSDPAGAAYWTLYQSGLHGTRYQPRYWTIHPTHDVERFEFDNVACVQPGCTTATFASWVTSHTKSNTHIWLTETAPDYRDPTNRSQTDLDREAMAGTNNVREDREARQNRGMQFALYALPAVSPKITRIYMYDFQQDCTVENGKGSRFDDSGLLAPECQGSPGNDRIRPAYHTLAHRYVKQ